MKHPSFLARKSLGQPNYFLLAMAIAFIVAFVPRGARKAVEGNTNKAEDWLPPNYSESVDLRWFRDHFVGEQFALISWDGCTLGNQEKLRRLSKRLMPSEQELAEAEPDSDIHKRAEWYSRVRTGPQVLEKMTSPPMNFSRGEAIKRLEGALIGPVKRDANGESLGHESRTTCLIVNLSEAATKNNRIMRQAIEHITEIAATECAIAEETIHMGGPPVDNITIDVEGERTLIRLASLSGIVGLALSYWCFRSMKLTSIVFAVGVLSAGMSLAIVFYFGVLVEVLFLNMDAPRLGTVDAILMSMPAVVYVLGLSGAIHIVNYYRDARRENGVGGAAESAVKMGWGPCTLAAFTTAVGLGSLYTSDILPIKKFGMFTAIAVMATVGLLFTVLPVFLHRFPVSDEGLKRQTGNHKEGHLPNWAKQLFGFVVGRYALTCIFWFIVMGTLAVGFTKIQTTVSLLKLLDQDTDLIHDYAWLEGNLGNLVPMEVILTVPPELCRTPDEHAEADGQHYRSTMLERLNIVRMIKHRMEQLPEISRVMSIATFAPESTDTWNTATNRSVDYATSKSLEEQRQLFLDDDFLRDELATGENSADKGRELIRLSARVAALSEDDESIDYGLFVQQLKEAVDPVLVALEQRDMIVTELHKAESSLADARLCVLYRSPDGEFPENSQEAVLKELLAQSGSTVRNITKFNLSKLDQLKGSPEYDKYLALLGKQDALVLASASSDPTAKQLAESGLTIIDVTDVSVYEDSAATPLVAGDQPRPIRAVYTGMIPLVFKTQRQLLKSLQESIAWATVLISVVMVFVLRSPLAGLISMIPNVFPIVIIFGGLGWLGIKVDIGIMMTASVALGVAVDDTIHFLTWFRRGVAQGMDRVQSVMLAYDRCATAMLQTTIIGGLGLAVFATSTFTPTQQFGYLMISMLGAALVGDLLLLPAILVSPLGRPFGGKAPAKHLPDGEVESPELPVVEQEQAVEEPSVIPLDSPETTAQPPEEEPTPPVAQYSADDFQQELQEGPHAALHAKLRSLRRDHPQDSINSN